jgi:Leucine-rich repeat (LRR) protein
MPNTLKKESLGHLGEFPALRELMIMNAKDEQFAAIPELKNLTGMWLAGNSFTDKTLQALSEKKSLEVLQLYYSPERTSAPLGISNDALGKLAELPNLRTLNMQGFATCNGEFFEKFVGQKNLTEMQLHLESLDDEGMKSLAKLIQVKKLVIGTGKTTAIGWESLKTMSSLEVLTVIPTTNVDDETVMGIAQLKNLRYLAIPAATDKLTSKGLAALKNLTELRSLFVGFDRSSATLHDLAFLADLKMLRKLMLHGVIVNDASFDHLKGLSDLRELTFISGPDLTDAAFQKIAHLKSLEVLHIDAPQLSDECFVQLKDLTALKRILLTGKNIRGKGLQELSNHPNILSILLEQSPIEDAYAKEFLKFPKLNRLFLRESKFSDDAVEDLSRLPAMKDLHLTGCGISDKGVEKFARIKSLATLNLQGTLVTEAGAERLQKLRPELGLLLKQTGVHTFIFQQYP